LLLTQTEKTKLEWSKTSEILLNISIESKEEKPEITLISVYDNYQVDPRFKTRVAPSHCTCDLARETFRKGICGKFY